MGGQVERRPWRLMVKAVCVMSCSILTSGIARADEALDALLARMSAAASAIILTILVMLMVAVILRVVDIRKEIAR